MLPLYLQFALNENDKALRVCFKFKNLTMYDYWFEERMRIYNQFFMPRLSDEIYSQLTIY
jgi:hypothetical protein